MAQTFDIRFARSAGLAGLFERPTNEFRWKGAGRLSIDATGISIAVQRGLLTLFASAQSRRFSPASLVEVYREGNALRLEFSTRESPRTVLPVWVSDRDSAAKIVTLLPTQRSVELEDDGPGTSRRYRIDRRLVALLSLAIVMIGFGGVLLQRYVAGELVAPGADSVARPATPADQDSPIIPSAPANSRDDAASTPDSPNTVSQSTTGARVPRQLDPRMLPASSMNAPAGSATGVAAMANGAESSAVGSASSNSVAAGVAPAPAKTAHQIAVEQFALFRAESRALHAEYLSARDSLAYERLEAIEAKWLSVTSRIVNTPEFGGSEFFALRELEIAISQNWRDHLSILAAALRAGGERRQMELADFHLAFAESVESQLSGLRP